jgi:lysophospholipase L1-like esterase
MLKARGPKRAWLTGVVVAGLLTTGVVPAAATVSRSDAPRRMAPKGASDATQTPGQIPGVGSLADCVRSGQPLLVLFLIDTSGSLQQTDPMSQRVAGVKTALNGLASLQATTTSKHPANIQVQLDGFSVGFNPAPAWTSLTNATLGGVDSQADTFATQNTGQDTDYYAALSGASQALANQAATLSSSQKPCKAIFWFTDGQYDVPDRLTPGAAATLGASKPYAPDIDLTMPGGGLQLIARGKQLLCQAGGLDDHMRADGIVTVAVAIDTQIAPSDQAFLNAVATGNGCGTPPTTPTGASLQSGDLSQLVLSFNAVANGTAGGTQLGGTNRVTPCTGNPCESGSQKFTVDKTLNRVTMLSLASNDGIDLLVKAPGVTSPLRITANRSGTTLLGATTVHFVWINAQTCNLELDLGANAAGQWKIIFLAPATLTAPGPVQTQLHVYADITPNLLGTPTLRAGSLGTFDVNLADSRGHVIPRPQIRHASVTATAADPLTGQQQHIEVRSFGAGHFHLLYQPSTQVSSITVIQITLIIITFGGVQLAPIQRTFREPIELPAPYPRLRTSEINLNTPQGTGGDGSLGLVGGTQNACVWIDPSAPQTSTPNTQITFTQTPSRSQCLKLNRGQHRSLPLTVIPNPALPGTIHTSIALHVVVVHVRVIVIIIPVTLTLTTQVLPQNGPTRQIVALGDSYSSGEGNPPFDLGTAQAGDTCHRSPQAWPRLIGVDASYLLACSDATATDLSQGQMPDSPDDIGQLTRLAQLNAAAPVNFVTVTIGGNDLGFTQILGDCVRQDCLRQLPKSEAKAQAVANNLATQGYPAIQAAAPNAKVLVVGYPRLLPTRHASVQNCAWLTSRNLTVMNQLQTTFNNDLQAAAQRAGATFVPTTDAFNGHELCTRNSWIVSVSHHCAPLTDIGDPTSAYCGHPTLSGQRAIADAVRQSIAGTNQPTAPPPAASGQCQTTAGLSSTIQSAAANDSRLQGVHAGVLLDGVDTSLWALCRGNQLIGYGVFLYQTDPNGGPGFQTFAAFYAQLAQACASQYAGDFQSNACKTNTGSFAGTWTLHDGQLDITNNGAAQITWQINDISANPPASGSVIIGLHITTIRGNTASAIVIARDIPPGLDPTAGPGVGPNLNIGDTYTFTLAPPGIVGTGSGPTIRWCDQPHQSAADCGA